MKKGKKTLPNDEDGSAPLRDMSNNNCVLPLAARRLILSGIDDRRTHRTGMVIEWNIQQSPRRAVGPFCGKNSAISATRQAVLEASDPTWREYILRGDRGMIIWG